MRGSILSKKDDVYKALETRRRDQEGVNVLTAGVEAGAGARAGPHTTWAL